MRFSDQEIIRAILDGEDEKVISSLYKSLLPLVTKYINANQGNSDDAFDLFQDAMLIFVKMVVTGKFDSEKYKISPYIFATTKNLWTNKMNRKGLNVKYEKTRLRDEPDQSILGILISEEKQQILEKVFNTLGSKCLELLTLFYYQNLSMKEIAIKLNLDSADNAKLKAHRCRKELALKIKSSNYILDHLKN